MTVSWVPLYAGSIKNTRTISNELDRAVYPRWTIMGPGYYPILTNNTTGAVLAIAYELLRGEVVTIDTDPTQKTIVSSVTGDITSHKTSASTYWSVAPGNISVSVDFGQTDTPSKITLALVPKAA